MLPWFLTNWVTRPPHCLLGALGLETRNPTALNSTQFSSVVLDTFIPPWTCARDDTMYVAALCAVFRVILRACLYRHLVLRPVLATAHSAHSGSEHAIQPPSIIPNLAQLFTIFLFPFALAYATRLCLLLRFAPSFP